MCLIILLLDGCNTGSGRRRNGFAYSYDARVVPTAVFDGHEIYLKGGNHDRQRVLNEIRFVFSYLEKWLGPPTFKAPYRIFFLPPDDPNGQRLIKLLATNQQVGGVTNHERRIMVVTGSPGKSKFWHVLRHEAVHVALRGYMEKKAPFWLEEGCASFLEAGGDEHGEVKPNVSRRRLAAHLAAGWRGLRLEKILARPQPDFLSGENYARAWCLFAYLYETRPSLLKQMILAEKKSFPFPFADYSTANTGTIKDFEKAVKKWLAAKK